MFVFGNRLNIGRQPLDECGWVSQPVILACGKRGADPGCCSLRNFGENVAITQRFAKSFATRSLRAAASNVLAEAVAFGRVSAVCVAFDDVGDAAVGAGPPLRAVVMIRPSAQTYLETFMMFYSLAGGSADWIVAID